jgi:predicted TIM-barrel fold metal-dependent hydrolase
MIIDFHTHIFPEHIAERTVCALAKAADSVPYSDGTEAGLRSAMERGGVSLSVNLPVLTKPSQFESILRFASSLNEKLPENLSTGTHILSFAGIHPEDPDLEEHLEAVAMAGIPGIKIHPDYQGKFIDDEAYIRALKIAKRLDLITVTHAGVDGAYLGEEVKCTPLRTLRALDKLGGYNKLVLAHLGASRMAEEVISTLAGEDVYFDTAYVMPRTDKATLARIVEKHGEDKILFATDSPWSDAQRDISKIKSFALGSDIEEKIFSGNAKGLLGIN